MVVMWVALVGVVLVVVVAVMVVVVRRPRGNDLSSVRKYHSALGTIEHLSERIGQAPVKVVGASEGTVDGGPPTGFDGGRGGGGPDGLEDDAGPRSGADPSGHVRTVPGTNPWDPSGPVRGNGGHSGLGDPLVFDDSHPREPSRREGSAQGAPSARAERAQRHALESMNRRPRRGITVMVAVVVVVVFATLALLGSGRSQTHHGQTGSATSPDSVTSTSVARTTASTSTTQARSARQGGHPDRRGEKPKPTPTTLPTRILAVSTTPGGATYPVSSNSYSVTVNASAPCWVLARTVSSGATLFTGTLEAGAARVIQATGAITVELGAPTASLSAENLPVVLPIPLHTPYVATFQPVALGAAPGSATTAPAFGSSATTG
jgi:hypothetical protein